MKLDGFKTSNQVHELGVFQIKNTEIRVKVQMRVHLGALGDINVSRIPHKRTNQVTMESSITKVKLPVQCLQKASLKRSWPADLLVKTIKKKITFLRAISNGPQTMTLIRQTNLETIFLAIILQCLALICPQILN